jgi:hypothetical protein
MLVYQRVNWTVRNDSNWVSGKSLLNKFVDVLPHLGRIEYRVHKKKELG